MCKAHGLAEGAEQWKPSRMLLHRCTDVEETRHRRQHYLPVSRPKGPRSDNSASKKRDAEKYLRVYGGKNPRGTTKKDKTNRETKARHYCNIWSPSSTQTLLKVDPLTYMGDEHRSLVPLRLEQPLMPQHNESLLNLHDLQAHQVGVGLQTVETCRDHLL